MIKEVLKKIQKFEKEKELYHLKQDEMQKKIDEIDINLKKLYSLKREYEKFEGNATDFLNSSKN